MQLNFFGVDVATNNLEQGCKRLEKIRNFFWKSSLIIFYHLLFLSYCFLIINSGDQFFSESFLGALKALGAFKSH